MITAEQRATRKQYIGSSDAAAILGLDTFKSAADVWLDKTGQTEEWQGNASTDRGTLLEPVILDWAQQTLGSFYRDSMKIHDGQILAANFDGIRHPKNKELEAFIVEAKSSVVPEEWGTENTDEVPDRVIVQVHHAMYVAGPEFRVAYVPVLLPGYRSFDFRMYRVDRRDELAETIAAECVDFMEGYVRPLIRPSEYRPSLDVLKRVKRTPSKVVAIDAGLVTALTAAQAETKAAKDRLEAVQAALLAELGDAEGATYDGGEITYLQTNRKGYQVEPCTFRTLRVKPAKK